MTEWQFRAIILSTADDKDSINSAVNSTLDRSGGEFTLTVGLSPNGQEPATHYWCSSKLTRSGIEGFVNLAPMFPESKGYVWAEIADPSVNLGELFNDIANVAISIDPINASDILSDNGLQVIQLQA